MTRSSTRRGLSASRDSPLPNYEAIRVPRLRASRETDEHSRGSSTAMEPSSAWSPSPKWEVEEIWIVPDPPTKNDKPSQASSHRRLTETTLSLGSSHSKERRRPREIQKWHPVPLGSNRDGAESKVSVSNCLPSPPPTPTIPRMDTPELDPFVEREHFCLCCRGEPGETDKASYQSGRSKMDSQRRCTILAFVKDVDDGLLS